MAVLYPCSPDPFLPGHSRILVLCLFSMLALAVVFLGISVIHPLSVPAAANDSTVLSAPAAAEFSPAAAVQQAQTVQALPANATGKRPLAITTFAAPVSSRTNRSAGTVIVFSGSAPSSCTASAGASGGPEIPFTDTALLEERVHEAVNRARQENNRSILGTDGALASVARAHSADMAVHGYFGHINLQEMDATARGAASGYRCSKGRDTSFTYPVMENLYADYWYDAEILAGCSITGAGWKTEAMLAADAVDAWLKSPDHRRNLLDPHTEREGIGVAVSDSGLVFITENMC